MRPYALSGVPASGGAGVGGRGGGGGREGVVRFPAADEPPEHPTRGGQGAGAGSRSL